MKRFLKAAVAAIICTILLGINACSKYEDGPKFSLLSKKARIQGDWTMEKYMLNDNDITSAFTTVNGANWTLDIEKSGTYRITGTFPDEGTWKFGEDKDDVYFTSNTPGVNMQSWRILRLKSKELWMRQTQPNGDVIKMYLKQ